MTRQVLTVREGAEVTGLSDTALRKAIKRGQIRSVRIGRRILLPRIPLERLLAGEASKKDEPIPA